MDDATEATESTDGAAVEAAFDALGDETRIAILGAFDPGTSEPVSFSELRERVGMRDSGRFNYHLDKLVGRFLRKSDEGYALTTTGRRVYGAILSGAYVSGVDFEPLALTEAGDACPICDGPLELRADDDRLKVVCADCGVWESNTAVPPSMVEGRDRESLPALYSHDLRTTLDEVISGFCSLCRGPTSGSFERMTVPGDEDVRDVDPDEVRDALPDEVREAHRDVDSDDVRDAESEVDPGVEATDRAGADGSETDAGDSVVMVLYECERCGNLVMATAGAILLGHPAVVSFYWDHGVDVRSVPVWRLPFVHPEAATVVQAEPMRVRVVAEHEGETLAVTLDEDLAVVDVERSG